MKFIFDSYSFDTSVKTATFNYRYDNGPEFTEAYRFNFEFVDFSPEALDRALQTLFFLVGVSYYKAYVPAEIEIKSGFIDKKTAEFLEKTYKKGLGELLYTNNLDPNLTLNFPVNSPDLKPIEAVGNGILVGVGGGKDSLLSIELLKDAPKIATWSLGHRAQLEPLVNKIGFKHFWVERVIDPKIIELNKQPGVYNGHVPISAIFAAVGSVVSILAGYRDHVVSNEQSANEATLEYQSTKINHQYSKTSEFEQDYQQLLAGNFASSLRYYSLLRPLREVAITREFSEKYFDKYEGVFSSCNRAFTQDSSGIYWCGECPKCAAVYLLLAPFLSEDKLVSLWSKNLLLEPILEKTYQELLGIAGNKPLECVGEIAENRWAMTKMKLVYPELNKYSYEEPSDNQVWSLSPHNIPEDIVKEFDLNNTFEQLVAAQL